ncbi:uncharacterized protein IL334_006601 [Kwoniella shivajii]|uniref:Uncharacterized protein n=1 Tax=Kwoniella shivajii TaxID=564305 RepID=A0ABZ1DAB3_9TREE|nr:hypothetical protein IL334_006601 [Kwoniella shivajii]
MPPSAAWYGRLLASQMRTMPPLPNADLSGKTFIVTGANSGIGLEVAKHLASRKANIILGIRNLKAGEEVKKDLMKLSLDQAIDVQIWPIDFLDFDSIARFARKCKEETVTGGLRLNGVVFSAGLYGLGWDQTPDGYEKVTKVNLVSTILLARLVIPLMHDCTEFKARMVFVGTALAETTMVEKFDLDNPIAQLNDDKRYPGYEERYNQTKTALHTQICQLMTRHPDIAFVDAAPGLTNSPFFKYHGLAVRTMAKIIGRETEKAARNISLPVLELTQSTEYHNDCKPSRFDLPCLDAPKGKKYAENVWNDIDQVYARYEI